MNLKYEFLQEIIVSTAGKKRLRLFIGRQTGPAFRLSGDYYDPALGELWLVDFSSTPHPSAAAPFEASIRDFNAAMVKQGDSIASLANPCNAHLLSKADQEAILVRLSIAAPVSVN